MKAVTFKNMCLRYILGISKVHALVTHIASAEVKKMFGMEEAKMLEVALANNVTRPLGGLSPT